MAHRNDPYKFLEDIGSERSLRFVAAANRICLKAFGDPTKSKSSLYPRILEILESDERIPIVSKMGKDASGNDLLYNLWKDSKVRAKVVLGKTKKSWKALAPKIHSLTCFLFYYLKEPERCMA